jgi:hypothetical protein
MSRLIIDNRSDLQDATALLMCLEVVRGGRRSNNDRQYCYLTLFSFGEDEYQVASDLNKASDKLIVVGPVPTAKQPTGA